MKRQLSLLSAMLRLALMMAFILEAAPVSLSQSVQAAATAGPSGETLTVPQSAALAAPAPAQAVRLAVVSARDEPWFGVENSETDTGLGILKGDPVTEYQWIINVDNTGDPDPEGFYTEAGNSACRAFLDYPDNTVRNPDYPEGCPWPSIQAQPSHAPILTQGDSTELNTTTTLWITPTVESGNKFLVSVLADGFKMGGQWFELPLATDVITVELQPHPLPAANISIRIFNDTAMTNGFPDVPSENYDPNDPTKTSMAGFVAHVADWGGETTTDVFGNPLCTEYQAGTGPFGYLWVDGAPVPVEGTGGKCISDDYGNIVIPNMGTNRWAVSAVPPDGSDWVQTSTLEGNLDWDTWVQEGATGLDTEFVSNNEPMPFTIFGFTRPTAYPGTTDVPINGDPSFTGEIKGVIVNAEVATPYQGGLPYLGSVWGGLSGAKVKSPIEEPYIALADLNAGDTMVYMGRGDVNGNFSIKGVPDGNYFLSYWDQPLMNLLDWTNVTVRNGEVVDLGLLFQTGWFTDIYGHVFLDENENGKMDPGEHGVDAYPLVVRRRENSEMDRGAVATVTEPDGSYRLENVYPLNQFLILEAYTDNYEVTGYTFQATNQAEETTITGSGVDVTFLPVIGQSGRIDWGVKPLDPGTNGGIGGTVFYDNTRNEVDPRYQAVEPWSPGIPGLTMRLWKPAKNPDGTFIYDTDGSIMKEALLNETTTEQWQRPVDCQSRDIDGNPIDHQVLPLFGTGKECLEVPLMGVQFESDYAAVDGNWGFSTIFSPSLTSNTAVEIDMPTGDYLVEVVVPEDSYGKPLYQVVKEEDVNVFGGDQYGAVPPTDILPNPAGVDSPDIPEPACAGPLHTVDVMGVGDDGPNAVFNPSFAGEGGSIYEGQDRPLCNIKLITVTEGRAIAPNFTLFTPTPIPGRWWGLIIDDLGLSTNPNETLFGEKRAVPLAPLGIYDFSNRLVTTILADRNGIFDVLLPSTNTMNCPSPSGVCANLYRLVGNDPGQPGQLNPTYNPQYRTIAATFETFPGIIVPADTAPTQVAVSIQAPGSQFNQVATCNLPDNEPQLFAVDKVMFNRATGGTLTIRGVHFGDAPGTVRIGAGPLNITSWSDTEITVIVPSNLPPGPQDLLVRRAGENRTFVNSVSIHIIGNAYTPTVFEVGPGKSFNTDLGATIQDAVDAAAAVPEALVVVYPRTPELWNPTGAYYENLIISSPVKLQGIGPGGVYPDTSAVLGSVINGSSFSGDGTTAAAWRDKITNLTWVGNQQIYEGAVISVFATSVNQFRSGRRAAAIDGFKIEGGDQQGFPNNINQIGGGQTGLPANVVIQGGGIYVNGYAQYLEIKNNLIQNNGGSYGGAIRLGTPSAGDNNNDNITVRNNQIRANGGTNLAGGLAIFTGSEFYTVTKNDFCGNYSAEYGGAISHYGYSPGGQISRNRIYFNQSYDEGGGIMIAGELPVNPATTLSAGAGPVNIFSNIIQSNLANDDGGGLRFLMAGNYEFNVYNNIIANNISTHEGGGISLNDAPNVRIFNNTIAKNITTATAMTSTGAPAPAGLSTSQNSNLLQASLPEGSPIYSNPVQFNNIFWDNRAGSWDGSALYGIGITGDPTPIYHWDLGVSDGSGLLQPISSTLTVDNLPYIIPDASNIIGVDPLFAGEYNTSVTALPWRGNPNFVGVNLVAVDLPPTLMGNYRLLPTSPAINAGGPSWNGVIAPLYDIDDELRPIEGVYDIGADETAAAVAAMMVNGSVIPDHQLFNTVIPGSANTTIRIFIPYTAIAK